jgi:hypothetical protein
MDDFLKYTKETPAAKYNVLDDWTKKFHPKAGKFLKTEKITFTGEVMNRGRKFKPCPGFYKFKSPSEESKGITKKTFNQEEKGCSFIDE